jgi:microcystin-dependent protein
MANFFAYPFATAGDKTAVPNPTQVSDQVSYESGWPVNYEYPLASNPSAYPISRTQMNQLFYDITSALQELQSYGTPQLITSMETTDGDPFSYPIFARVYYDAGGGAQLWENQLAGNTTLPGIDDTWAIISGGGSILPGTIIAFAGTTAPAGYLPLDGSIMSGTVSRTTYANLYAAIGTTWGVGDGSTTFGIPNMARRVPVGSGGTGTGVLGNAVSDTGGTESYTLGVNDIAPHTHDPSASNAGWEYRGTSGGSGYSTESSMGPNFVGSSNLNVTGGVTGQATQTPVSLYQPSAVVLYCMKY